MKAISEQKMRLVTVGAVSPEQGANRAISKGGSRSCVILRSAPVGGGQGKFWAN